MELGEDKEWPRLERGGHDPWEEAGSGQTKKKMEPEQPPSLGALFTTLSDVPERPLVTLPPPPEANQTVAAKATKPSYKQLERDLAFYKEREQHLARVLGVADGGQYRADWDGRLGNLLREVAAWREHFPKMEFRPQDDCISLKFEYR